MTPVKGSDRIIFTLERFRILTRNEQITKHEVSGFFPPIDSHFRHQHMQVDRRLDILKKVIVHFGPDTIRVVTKHKIKKFCGAFCVFAYPLQA
jgi:hypothetical protein